MPKSAAGTIGKVAMADQAGDGTGLLNGSGNGASPYSVIHVRRTAPEEIIIQPVVASDETAAREKAMQTLGDITVLHICREDGGSERPTRPETAAGDRDYPSARFINGEFRAQTFSDEALLYAMAE